jgi:hypothetical protein
MARNVVPMIKSRKFQDDYDDDFFKQKKAKEKSRRNSKRDKFQMVHEFLFSKELTKEE